MSYYSEGKLFNDNQTPDTVGLHFFPCHVQEIYFALVEYYTIRYIIQFNNHRSFFPGPQRIHFIAKELVKLEKMRTLINIKCKNYFQRTKMWMFLTLILLNITAMLSKFFKLYTGKTQKQKYMRFSLDSVFRIQ